MDTPESASRVIGIPLTGVCAGLSLPLIPHFVVFKSIPFAVSRLACEVAIIAATACILRFVIKRRKIGPRNAVQHECLVFALMFCLPIGLLLYPMLASLKNGTAADVAETLISTIVGCVAGLLTLIYWTPREPHPNACASCGYDLKGVSKSGKGICPECGEKRASPQIEDAHRSRRTITPSEFLGFLRKATAATIEFAHQYVENDLPQAVHYHVQLDRFGGQIKDPYRVYPDIAGREYFGLSEDEVTQLLFRDGWCPRWIDAAVEASSQKETQIWLLCGGQFTDDLNHMYYTPEGRGPFGILSPRLPIGQQKGQKFKIPSLD